MHDTMHIVHSSSRNLNFEGLGAVNDAPYGVAQLGAGTHSCTCAQLHQPSTCSLVVMQPHFANFTQSTCSGQRHHLCNHVECTSFTQRGAETTRDTSRIPNLLSSQRGSCAAATAPCSVTATRSSRNCLSGFRVDRSHCMMVETPTEPSFVSELKRMRSRACDLDPSSNRQIVRSVEAASH
jgi:hypothetical protein